VERTFSRSVSSLNDNLAKKAIVETGSNTNGSYVKFGDGTMICTHDLDSAVGATASGGVAFSPDMLWTYPQPFAIAPNLQLSVKYMLTSGANPISATRATSSGVGLISTGGIYVVYDAPNATVKTRISVMAVGKWK
jgi:hypothetical protein